MPTDNDVETQRELASHAVEIANMKKLMDDMALQLRAVNGTLQEINRTLSEAKGGWKTLLWIGGASGLGGALLGHALHVVRGG